MSAWFEWSKTALACIGAMNVTALLYVACRALWRGLRVGFARGRARRRLADEAAVDAAYRVRLLSWRAQYMNRDRCPRQP